jgi:hypothetical protein
VYGGKIYVKIHVGHVYKYRLINTAAIIKDAKITLGKYIRFFASTRSEYMEVWRGEDM